MEEDGEPDAAVLRERISFSCISYVAHLSRHVFSMLKDLAQDEGYVAHSILLLETDGEGNNTLDIYG